MALDMAQVKTCGTALLCPALIQGRGIQATQRVQKSAKIQGKSSKIYGLLSAFITSYHLLSHNKNIKILAANSRTGTFWLKRTRCTGFTRIWSHLPTFKKLFFCKFDGERTIPNLKPETLNSKLAEGVRACPSLSELFRDKNKKNSQTINSRYKKFVLGERARKPLIFRNLKLKTENFKLTEGAEFLTKAVHPRALGFGASLGTWSLGTWVFANGAAFLTKAVQAQTHHPCNAVTMQRFNEINPPPGCPFHHCQWPAACYIVPGRFAAGRGLSKICKY